MLRQSFLHRWTVAILLGTLLIGLAAGCRHRTNRPRTNADASNPSTPPAAPAPPAPAPPGGVAVLGGTCGASAAITPNPSGADWTGGGVPAGAAPLNAQLSFQEINTYRQSLGLPPLQWHNGMGAVAQNHNNAMAATPFLAVVNPQTGLSICAQMVSAMPRIDFTQAFSFVTNDQASWTAAERLQILLADPGSRAAIENPAVTHHVGTFAGGKATLIFGINVTP